MSPEELLLLQAEADEAAASARAQLVRARLGALRSTLPAAEPKSPRPARPSVTRSGRPVDELAKAKAVRKLRSLGIEPNGDADAA